MDISAKMPAIQDSTLAAKMPATIASDAPPTGGDGPVMAPQGSISQKTVAQSADYDNDNVGTQGWEADDRKSGDWQAEDRDSGTEAP